MTLNERFYNTVFDELTDDCLSGFQHAELIDNECNIDRIASLTFSELGLRSKNKKRKKQKLFVFLAAAVSLMLIGSVTAAASGEFTPAFSEYIAGEPADGVFSGGNVYAESDITDIDFHGVTGDEHTAAVSMTFKKKDGTPFIDENLLKESNDLIIEVFSEYRPFYSDNSKNNEWYGDHDTDSTYMQEYSCTIPIKESIKSYLGHRRIDGGMTANEYTFKDSKTINYYAEYSNTEINIKGQRLTLKLKDLYVSHIDKVLYTKNDFTDFEQWEKFRTDPKTYEKLNEDYKDKLNDNQSVRITPGWDRIVIATKYEIPLHYSVSADLNYRTINRELIKSEKIIHTEKGEQTLYSLSAGAYGIRMKTKAEISLLSEDTSRTEFEQLTITLKNGTAVTADLHTVSGSSADNNNACFEAEYSYYEKDSYDKGKFIRFTLDPTEIISVKLGENEFVVTA